MEIVDIDLEMPISDFEAELVAHKDNWNASMDYEIKQMSSKQGKSMYKIRVENDDQDYFEIIAQRDSVTENIIFRPMKFGNYNDSFYSHNNVGDIMGQDEDPGEFLRCFFMELCKRQQKVQKRGVFASIGGWNTNFVVKDGTHHKGSLALVDEDGNVYSCTNAEKIKDASENANFNVNKPIAEWLNENLDVKSEISKLQTMDEKMNYVGKYLINQKLNSEIDADDFMDIFCQAGIIGFSDASVLGIYKLIM